MTRGVKRIIIVVVATFLIRSLYSFGMKIYFTPERDIPTVTDVTYSKQNDFILVGCEIYTLDGIDRVELHYNGEVIEMRYNTAIPGQEDYPRYVAQIPLIDDSIEVKIIPYDIDGDSSTYVLER